MTDKKTTGFGDAIKINDYALDDAQNGFLIMPERVDAVDGTGYYGEEASSVYRELKELGYEPQYATKVRTSIHRRSGSEFDLIQLSIGFVIGIASNAAYDGLKAWITYKASKKPNPVVRGKIYIEDSREGHRGWQEYQIDGDVDSAIKIIDKIQGTHETDANTGNKETHK